MYWRLKRYGTLKSKVINQWRWRWRKFSSITQKLDLCETDKTFWWELAKSWTWNNLLEKAKLDIINNLFKRLRD